MKSEDPNHLAIVYLKDRLSAASMGIENGFRHLPAALVDVFKKRAWKKFKDRSGEWVRFKSFRDFAESHPPGLHRTLNQLEALLQRCPESERLPVLALWTQVAGGTLKGAALKQARAEGGKRGGRGKKNLGANGTKVSRGTNQASTLARRILSKSPAIFARLERGEFKSMRAAAIEAGIVKLPSGLDRLRAAWHKATSKERRIFLDEVI